MSFRRVAALADIAPGAALCVRLDGLELGLFRVGDEIHAMENACPHAGHPLSEGELEGPVVVCPAHGFRYDVRTGFNADAPDGFPIPRFAVRVEADDVLVDTGQVLGARRRRA